MIILKGLQVLNEEG